MPVPDAERTLCVREDDLAFVVSKMHPEAGDILVLRVPQQAIDTPQKADVVLRQLHALLPEGVRGVVVESSCDIDIVKAVAGTYPVIQYRPDEPLSADNPPADFDG